MGSWGVENDAFDVVLVGDARGEMAEAVALAGGRVTTRPAAGETLADAPGALVVVELGGADRQALDGLTAWAERADVVSCDLEQLDLVAGALLLTDAELLCAPSPVERVAALTMAARDAAAPAGVRDDAARLRRLRAEVARLADALGRLAADEGAADLADRRPAFDAGPTEAAPVDPRTVRRLIRARRARDGFFGAGLFEDPAWDMLLDLFAAEGEGAQVSVSSLCIAAHVAPTTALRWVNRLVAEGLFERRPDPQDRRRAFIALSERGSAAMRGWFGAARISAA